MILHYLAFLYRCSDAPAEAVLLAGLYGAALDGGDDGAGGASLTTATVTRGETGIENLGGAKPENVARVLWRIESERVGFTSAGVTFRYLDSEVSGGTGSRLTLYQAPAPTGPWTIVPGQSHDDARREISGTVGSLEYFAILRSRGTASLGSAMWTIFK